MKFKFKALNFKFNLKFKFLKLLTFGFGLILVIGILLFWSIQSPANITVINLTSWGFQPSKITIKAGDIVKFQNIDNIAHWPASNIHPTHLIYPEFDPKKGVLKGQSWSFQFNRVGVWRMHDHLNPSFTGQIAVVSSSKNTQLSQIWQDSTNFFQSIPQAIIDQFNSWAIKLVPGLSQKEFSKLDIAHLQENDAPKLDFYLKNFGVQPIEAKLLKDTGEGDLLDCHRQAHFIGREAFKLFGAQVFATTDYSCHSGFIHGAMEAFLSFHGTVDLKADVTALCSQLPTSFTQFECLHGVGHGVMAYQDYNLPAALADCQKLNDSFANSSCYGGVFMENVIAGEGEAAIIGHSTSWVSNDPYFPCDTIDQAVDVQIQCYMMQTSRMLDIDQHNFNIVAGQCLQAPIEYRGVCFQSFGRDVAGQTLRDPQKIITDCAKVNNQYYNNCITGAVNVIVDFWGRQMADKPYALCKLVPQTSKNNCYQTIGGRLTGILGNNQNQIVSSCNFAEGTYQQICRQAAGV